MKLWSFNLFLCVQKIVIIFVQSFPETSLGVPDFSEIIGKSRSFEDFGTLDLSDFLGRPSALDLSNEPEVRI